MSVSVANPEAAALPLYPQPFQCHICLSRFTRHENLTRHARVHSRSADKPLFTCDICHINFSRIDLRHRHMKRKHLDKTGNRPAKRLQHAPAVAGDWRNGPRLKESEVRLPPSAGTSYRLQPQQSFNEVELEVDDWAGQAYLPETQHQLDHNVQNHRAMGSTAHPSTSVSKIAEEEAINRVESWLIQPPTANQKRVAQFEQEANQFDQRSLLEPPSFDYSLGGHFGDELHPPTELQPTSPDNSSNGSSPRTSIPDGLSSSDLSNAHDDWYPSPSQTARGYHLYFTHVSHFVPFIHRPTFDATEIVPHLGLGMLCLAYQYGEDPDCSEQAGSGASLSLRCFHRARVSAAFQEEIAGDLLHKINLVQTYWLLQVCVMMYLCGEDSAYGLKVHSRMISLARFGGLTQAIPVESAESEDLDALWKDFIRAESQKRTLLAVHQIDALWYQLFSIPRSLSHLEIKHDLPCREEYWTAASSTQWAHRQLASKQTSPLVPYSDAVRCVLSPDIDINTLPAFDLYGVVSIAQFLLSSAREVSGWSTMTGRLSLERFEPLRSSLISLERLIRPQAKSAKSTHTVSCEATWEIAMIELLIWSPSHTCGIVGGNVEAFLNQSTYLASSCKISKDLANNSAVQPHIDWFLRYLDTKHATDSEPPWITLYAYKAFLIAWQLLQQGVPGAMLCVGIHEGDIRGAIVWARNAFQRRQRQHQQLGKLIDTSLSILGT